MPIDVLASDAPLADVMRDAVGAAVDPMDEHASAFEELSHVGEWAGGCACEAAVAIHAASRVLHTRWFERLAQSRTT